MQNKTKDPAPILKFATDWLKERRDAIRNAFANRLFIDPEESAELLIEYAEIEIVLDGEE